VSVRRARADEWERLRDLRLRGLREDPHAFTSTYENEKDDPEEEWRSWTEESAVFVAGDWEGMTASFLVDDDSARLVAMYVTPEARGRGFGRELVAAVEEWASEQGSPRVVLWLKPENVQARTLYERCGYRATGEVREDGSLYFEKPL
jgi:GNAT superfamily N-acetyltransferase